MTAPERLCSNCRRPLRFVSIVEFRTGGSSGALVAFLGPLAEAREKQLALALWGCAACGKIDLYLPPS